MLELVFANLRVRPLRTFISVIGVSIGVVLVVLFTGLAKGMTNEMSKRAANWKAEIIFTRPGGMDATSSNASVDLRYVPRLLEIQGVHSTTPVLRYVTPDTRGNWGIRQLDGVEWGPFSAMNEINIIKGRPPEAFDEVIVDERQLESENLSIGGTYELFGGKPYKITGVFGPPSGSRIKLSLAALQDALQTDKCTYILVKVKDGFDPAAVAAEIDKALPGNRISLTSEFITDAQERLPGLTTFLRVLVLLGAFVSTVFVLLSMYTTITERRKEIGILKSLGASKSFIIGTIEGEALVVGILGIFVGLGIAFAASQVISRQFDLAFEFSLGWILTAVAIAIGGSLVGALYPAWRASAIDPVEVMVNE